MSRVIPQAVKCPTCDHYNELCSHVAARIEYLESVRAGLEELVQRTEANGDMADQAVNVFVKELMK